MHSFTRGALTLAALVAATAAHGQNFSEGYKFLKAVRDADGNEVTALLAKPGTTVIDARDISTGETALQIAVARSDSVWVGFLLAKGANPNLGDSAGNTPLITAIENDFEDGVKRLVGGKANINLANRSGETPLIRAVQRRKLAMVRLLIDSGADPDRRDIIAGMSARDYAKVDTRNPALLEAIEAAKRAPAAGMAGPRL